MSPECYRALGRADQLSVDTLLEGTGIEPMLSVE